MNMLIYLLIISLSFSLNKAQEYNKTCLYSGDQIIKCDKYKEFHYCDDDNMCESGRCYNYICNRKEYIYCKTNNQCPDKYYCNYTKIFNGKSMTSLSFCTAKILSTYFCTSDISCQSNKCSWFQCV